MDIKFNYSGIIDLNTQIEALKTSLLHKKSDFSVLGHNFDNRCSFYSCDEYGSYIEGYGWAQTEGFFDGIRDLLAIIENNLGELSQIIDNKVKSYSTAELVTIEGINEIDSILDGIE